MSDERNGRKPIEPPTTNKKRALARAVAEGVAGFAPGGSLVAGILRVTHPPEAEQDREEWQRAISERANEHAERLDRQDEQISPRETLTGTTAQLIAALARDCPDGRGQKHYTLDMIAEFLPQEDKQALEDAAYELEALGLVHITRVLGGLWHFSLTPEFYEQIDHQIMGWATVTDAVEIARLMLADDTGRARDLHEKTGWSRRRFNPAFRHLLSLFPDGRIRDVIQPDYVALGVDIAPEDKAALRRFVKRNGRCPVKTASWKS